MPYSAAQLRKLYGNYANYRKKYEAAKAQAVRQRYLLPQDAAHLEPVAKPANFEGDGE
jgi:hypothetical protein